ncbi:tumor necrosis factor receptor superfamily member 19L isoform X1 [Aquila chrysaetos chrysaetos]|nr:tumor necrosis factor receptor superfamily member 19L isoform X1 [Aquila chrysaetos chrysaetos]XP_029898221.1 tumor necrosis factor receptor superfamily member 19L isoform X1 [Aquila chrysaetos chrysaetos]XP_029898222.1 tumor necrosis factor receptor superfamily member 19L isoform X1 [Aquila chrysaetos chrysaetos]
MTGGISMRVAEAGSGSPPAMKRSGMRWWLVTVLGVLSGPGVGAGSCGPREHGTPGCPPGEEPAGTCSSAQGPVGTCRACPPGTFSPGDISCSAHTRCRAGNRILVAPGTAMTDSRCGACLPGFYSPEGEREPRGRCLPCADAPRSTPGCPGRRRARSPETLGRPSGTNRTWVTLMGEEEEEEEEAAAAQAAVLTIVPVFCAMGLLGILVCNLLKKKGYHCTAGKDPQPGGTGPSSIYQLEDANEDTIGVLVRLITEKKENAAALEELLKEHHGQQPMPPPGCTPPNKLYLLPQFPLACRHQQHLHTVQGPAPCARCSQKKWPEVLPSLGATKVPKPGGRPSEVTILSIGRFRVSRIPEMRSEAGGEPPRGPLPAGSGMRPPWLKSIDGPPELAPALGAASGGR